MAYQFVHVNTYSIKTGGAGIAAEAGRKPDHSRHVAEPKPPVLLAGVQPELAWTQIEQRHDKARDLVTLKNGRKAERKLRNDANVLLAAVASYPEPTETVDITAPEFQDWQKRALEWFTVQHGEPLSAVLHLDETHPHIHFLTAPDLENGQRMQDIHAGEKAKAEVGGRKAGRVEKRQAFSEAMRQYQDGYHTAVGIHHGQARLGPKRQRLSRDEWKAQQAEGQRQAERLRDIEAKRSDQEQAAQRQRQELDEAKAGVEVSRDEVGQAQAQVSEQQQAVDKAQAEVRQEHKKLDSRRETLKNKRDQLQKKIDQVTQRERKLGGIFGAIVSAVTLGKAGTKRQVQKAVSVVQAEFNAQLDEQARQIEKAGAGHQRAVHKLDSEKARLTTQVRKLNYALVDSEKARGVAETQLHTLTEKLGPLEANNSQLAANRDQLRALLDDIEAAADSGDLAAVQDLLDPDDSGPELRM